MTLSALGQTLFRFAEQYLQRPLTDGENVQLQNFQQSLNAPENFAGLLQMLNGLLGNVLNNPSTAGATAQTGGFDLSSLLSMFSAFQNKGGESGNDLRQMLLNVAAQYLQHKPDTGEQGATPSPFGMPGNLMDTIRSLGGMFSHADSNTATPASMSEAHKSTLMDNLNSLLTMLNTFQGK